MSIDDKKKHNCETDLGVINFKVDGTFSLDEDSITEVEQSLESFIQEQDLVPEKFTYSGKDIKRVMLTENKKAT
ncbi:hypothetical protein [Vibrio sp. E150_018]